MSRVGSRFDPGGGGASSVISSPNGNSSSAKAGDIAGIATIKTKTTATNLKSIAENIWPHASRWTPEVLSGADMIDQIGRCTNQAGRIPAPRRGDVRSARRERYFSTIAVNG
jgi:hypothetical protein